MGNIVGLDGESISSEQEVWSEAETRTNFNVLQQAFLIHLDYAQYLRHLEMMRIGEARQILKKYGLKFNDKLPHNDEFRERVAKQVRRALMLVQQPTPEMQAYTQALEQGLDMLNYIVRLDELIKSMLNDLSEANQTSFEKHASVYARMKDDPSAS